jgi:hypothetical protein
MGNGLTLRLNGLTKLLLTALENMVKDLSRRGEGELEVQSGMVNCCLRPPSSLLLGALAELGL